MTTVIELSLPRGNCPIHVFGEPGSGSSPVVLLFMDAFGPRPALFDIAARLENEGFTVLLPQLFYHCCPRS
jgi:carboxymethylenebutenolidase